MTLNIEAQLSNETYDSPDSELAHFFAYNLARCNANSNGLKYQDLVTMKADIIKCQSKGQKAEVQACGQALFGLYQ